MAKAKERVHRKYDMKAEVAYVVDNAPAWVKLWSSDFLTADFVIGAANHYVARKDIKMVRRYNF